MRIDIDEKTLLPATTVNRLYVLELHIDESLQRYVNDATATGLFGEDAAETAIQLIRRSVQRLVTDNILDLWDGDGYRERHG